MSNLLLIVLVTLYAAQLVLQLPLEERGLRRFGLRYSHYCRLVPDSSPGSARCGGRTGLTAEDCYARASTTRWSIAEVNGSPSKPPYTASTSNPDSRSINSNSSRPTMRMVRSCALRFSRAPEVSYHS